MHRKSIINTCNYLGYVSVIIGVLLSIYTFDLDVFLNFKEVQSNAGFSVEEEYLQSFVKHEKGLFFDNVIKSLLVFFFFLLVGVNLWYKASMLGKDEEVDFCEEEIEDEDVEEGK